MLAAAFLFAGACAAEAEPADAPTGPEFLSGIGRNPEDMAPIGSTGFAVVASLSGHQAADGSFVLLDMASGALSRLPVDFSGPAAAIYEGCAAVPAGEFIAHGLSLHEPAPGRFELLAINHGNRAVEVFDFDGTKGAERLRWKGCVKLPEEVAANDLAAYGDGGFALTSFGMRDDRDSYDKITRGEPSGAVLEWLPGKGWSYLSRNRLSGPNGIAFLGESDALVVSEWGKQSLVQLSRSDGSTRTLAMIPGFHPDNMNWFGKDIIVAGQTGKPADIFACAGVEGLRCSAPGKVYRVRPETGAFAELASTEGDYGAVSVAALSGDRLYVGSFRDDRLALYRLSEAAVAGFDR